MSEGKNPERVAAGLKATVHNQNTSEEAKLRAVQRLNDMGVDIDQPGSSHKTSKGSSATGASKTRDTGIAHRQTGARNASEPGKYAGMDMDDFLEDEPDVHGDVGRSSGPESGQAGENRVMGGYRATLKNPRVSQQAKEHAKEVLEENNEPLSTR